MMRWWRWDDDGDDDDCECVRRRYGCSLKGESSYRDPTPPAYHPLLLWIHLLQISSISSRHQFLNKKNSLWKDSSPCSALILKWCICWQTAGALLFNISTLSMVFNHKLHINKKPAPHLMCFMDHQEITFHNLEHYLSLDWLFPSLSYPFSDCEIYPSVYSSEKELRTQKPEWIDLLSKEWISITLKKEKEICEQGARFHVNQEISMFSLSIILTFKNHQSTKDPFPFKLSSNWKTCEMYDDGKAHTQRFLF